jgi:phage terminase large subunit-like protein
MKLFLDGHRDKSPEAAPWLELLSLLPGYDPLAQAQGCWFEPKVAQFAIDFIQECLTHIEGAIAGKPFLLERWQQSFVANLFGWKRVDEFGREVRRFREALLYVARKNGKTPLVAAIALLVFFTDDEAGQQDYIAASTSDQAALLFRQCKGMVDNEPELSRRCRAYGGHSATGQSRSLVREEDASYLRVISAEAVGSHGKTTHLAIIDEVHEQPNRELLDSFQTSFSSTNRKQPLFILLTTADYAGPSVCNEKYEFAVMVRDNKGDPAVPGYAPHFLPAIFELGPDDDWTDEKQWVKANPNLGVSVSLSLLRGLFVQAKEIPAFENTFRRLHCNQRTEQDKRAINMQAWKVCGHGADPLKWRAQMLDSLKGKPCFSGLDLGSTNDLTAFVLWFPDCPKPWPLLPFFWATKNAIDRRRRNKVPYDVWVRQGFMRATDGNVTDYDVVRADLNKIANDFGIQATEVDRVFQGAQLCTQLLGDGFNVKAFAQTFLNFAYPCRRVLEMIADGDIDHGNNPVMTWMAGNASTQDDPNSNLKWSKESSGDKIDGLVAWTMAVATSLVEPMSIYESRGLVVLEQQEPRQNHVAPQDAAEPVKWWGTADHDEDD